MAGPKSSVGALCLFTNGLILMFYGVLVPTFVHDVHWLITLVAILFIIALPAINHYLSRVHKVAATAVAGLLGVGMLLILASDIMLVSALIPRFTHDLIYVLGNALFVVSLFAVGVLAWKGDFPKWLSVLSLVAGVVGALTYIPGVLLLLTFAPSLLLVGVWSLAMGFIVRKAT